MKKILAFILFICLFTQSLANAADLSFTWTPNSEAGLAGYKIYYGSASREYTGFVDVHIPPTTDGKVLATVPIPWGNKFFAATAYDLSGQESDYSNEVSTPVPLDAPAELTVSAITVTFTPRSVIDKTATSR